MSRPSQDSDELSTKRTSPLALLRHIAVMAMIAAAAGVGLAGLAIDANSSASAAGVGVVAALGVVVFVLLSVAETRFEREQNRMQNMWMARKAELQELVGKDELTQLQNRRFFYEQL
ncbi:MAG: hypothetical protein ABIP58_05645, partial [Dehalococcoidia bacterium]